VPRQHEGPGLTWASCSDFPDLVVGGSSDDAPFGLLTRWSWWQWRRAYAAAYARALSIFERARDDPRNPEACDGISVTAFRRPPRSDGVDRRPGPGGRRIPAPTSVPWSRAQRRPRRSRLPVAIGSPAMTSDAVDPNPLLRHATTKWPLASQPVFHVQAVVSACCSNFLGFRGHY
jgi:hypothetical protein